MVLKANAAESKGETFNPGKTAIQLQWEYKIEIVTFRAGHELRA